MAYVNFWKLPKASYKASEHSGGIFLSSDTGEVYLFGNLINLSNSNNTKIQNIITKLNLIGRVSHIKDEQAFTVQSGKVKLMFDCVGFNPPDSISNHTVEIPEASTSQNGLMSTADKTKVDKLITNGNGKSYLNNAGQYVNPFPIVSQEEALTINSDGSLGHKAIVDMKAWDTTSTPLTLSQLNSTYPDAPVGFIVVQYNAQAEYEKVSSTNQWVKRQVELLTD